MKIIRLLSLASAGFFIAGSALAQQGGTVTQYAFAIGKGAGSTSFTSLLCGSAQLAVGQSAAAPICRTLTGDVTLDAAGATAIGATKVTSAMLNSNVYSTAHTWAGQQTFVAPILGTPASGTLTNATGLPISTGVSGLGTGIATWLGTPTSANLISAVTDETGSGALVFGTSPVLVTPNLGTPSAATLTNATGLPVATGISGLGTSVATFLATPSSANLRAALTDEVGTGAAYFVGGALGTPASGTATNLTGLPLSTGVTGTLQAAQFPALTGDVTTISGALATALATVNANVGTFGSASAVPTFTVNGKGLITAASSQAYQNGTAAVKGVVQCDGTTITCSSGVITAVGAASTSIAVGTTTITGGTSGHALYNNAGVLGSRTVLPTTQLLTASSGTYTTPAGALWLEIIAIGGGGGGGGGNNISAATSGADTCWNTSGAACTTPVYRAGGGGGGASNASGTASTTTGTCNVLAMPGSQGGPGTASIPSAGAAGAGGSGGSSSVGGAAGGSAYSLAGLNAATNSGSGGGGGGVNGSALSVSGYGGAAGATCSTILNSPAASYTYAVGTGGTGASAGTNGAAGGNGAAGRIMVIEHYN